MGLIDFLKKKLGLEDKYIILEDEKPSEHPDRRFIEQECMVCKKVIGYDKYTKPQGHFMHKPCFKAMKKQVGL